MGGIQNDRRQSPRSDSHPPIHPFITTPFRLDTLDTWTHLDTTHRRPSVQVITNQLRTSKSTRLRTLSTAKRIGVRDAAATSTVFLSLSLYVSLPLWLSRYLSRTLPRTLPRTLITHLIEGLDGNRTRRNQTDRGRGRARDHLRTIPLVLYSVRLVTSVVTH